MNLNSIFLLYADVLNRDIKKYKISVPEVRKGIQSMGHVYAPDSTNFESTIVQLPNYNDRACRIAYLHKYAPLHTYIVLDTTLKILQANPAVFRDLLINIHDLKFCSIGGGPGSDVIGVMTALQTVFGTFSSSITIIDCMKNWRETFDSIIYELKVGPHCKIWNSLTYDCRLNFNYIGANLLCAMTNEVNKTIGSASLLTMIKFVSAAICTDTEEMVAKIFRVMKPGALVLYIDNAAGGFTQIVERSAKRNGLVAVYGPERHVTYEAEALKVERFGYTSCYRTKVTVILLQKVVNYQFIKENDPTVSDSLNSNTAIPSAQENPINFVVLENNARKTVMGNSIPFSDWKAKNIAVSNFEPCNVEAKNISSQTIEPYKDGANNISNKYTAQSKITAKNISVPIIEPYKDGTNNISNTYMAQNKIAAKNISIPTIEPNKIRAKNNSSTTLPQNKTRSKKKNSGSAMGQSNVGTKNNSSLPGAPEQHSTSIHVPSTKVNNSNRYTHVPLSDAESKITVPAAGNNWAETENNEGDTCCSCCVIS